MSTLSLKKEVSTMDTQVKKPDKRAIPAVPLKNLETLWLQVGGTLCNLECTHCFISCGPKNDTIPMMTLSQVKERLEESKVLNVKDYYITGGEVFINPEIFEILTCILSYGPLDVLTNGTQITSEKALRLRAIQDSSEHPLQFRVSMESFEESANDAIRGKDAYRKAVAGIACLAEVGFSPILTITRTWEEEQDTEMELKFIDFLESHEVPKPRIKILPGFLLGKLADNNRSYNDEERVTEGCFDSFDITQLQCATSRMATGEGVYVCPILVDNPKARMGNTIEETLRPFPLSHPACYTCRVTGMTCKSSS
ncbi:MAG: radical SAM protein [Nitrospina sp.]|jgi:sulfatase maturation enzyme AslB (radical SAM superfamily)|nr:radical SAM protein [Nitrospina sp.]MBT3508089.1 radical SAM protein [Nitrospina sp.]MBT3875708.1 radical SAM protein [Nitrospina sp.]MBT4049635.1 radical SAM protein [Nitrospina sp.]MBT4558347.1 radical SAM protein [Nitrospina sp.]